VGRLRCHRRARSKASRRSAKYSLLFTSTAVQQALASWAARYNQLLTGVWVVFPQMLMKAL
jgi:hypothetical protein